LQCAARLRRQYFHRHVGELCCRCRSPLVVHKTHHFLKACMHTSLPGLPACPASEAKVFKSVSQCGALGASDSTQPVL
jgi:hypothetical protein